MLELKGPWQVEHLRTLPRCPWQDDRLGTYVVAIAESRYRLEYGPSRFIYIGGMGTTANASLRQRVGDFLVDAFGFLHHHSGGTRFYEELTLVPVLNKALSKNMDISENNFNKIKDKALSPWDLEFWWYETDDPLCCEAMLMKAYKRAFGKLPRLNKKQNRHGCGYHLNELNSGEYEIGTKYPWARK